MHPFTNALYMLTALLMDQSDSNWTSLQWTPRQPEYSVLMCLYADRTGSEFLEQNLQTLGEKTDKK